MADDPLNNKEKSEKNEKEKKIELKHEELDSEEISEEIQGKGQASQAQQDDKDRQIEELKNALARSMADLQNFKRRNEEEKVSFIKFAHIELLKNILPFVDNFDRTVLHLPENLKTDSWAKGVVHMHDDLIKTLTSMGIQKMKTVGEKLDPTKHEGLMSGPGEKDIIIEEFEAGYLMGDTIVKVAKVKVGDGS